MVWFGLVAVSVAATTEGELLISIDMWVLDTICFKITVEATIQYSVGLGVGFSWIGEATQELVHLNHPLITRK